MALRPKLHSIMQSETLWTGGPAKEKKASCSCLLAGFSPLYSLLKSLTPCHCALPVIATDFWEQASLPWAAAANGGKGGMKVRLAKSPPASDRLIMKSNYREASWGGLCFALYLSKDPSCSGCLMCFVKDSFWASPFVLKLRWDF